MNQRTRKCTEHGTFVDFCLMCQLEHVRSEYGAISARLDSITPLDNYTEFYCDEHGTDCKYVATVQVAYLPFTASLYGEYAKYSMYNRADFHYRERDWNDPKRWPATLSGLLACGGLCLWQD